MPTFTTIALDRLIDSGASKSMTTIPPLYKQERREPNPTTRTERGSSLKHERSNSMSTTTTTTTTTTTSIDKKHPWVRITPALYATPQPKPLPDSPSSFPPSPYIINHKRRGPRLLKSSSEYDVASDKPLVVENKRVDENGKHEEDATEVEHVNDTVDRDSRDVILNNNSVTQNELVGDSSERKSPALSVDGGYVGELDNFFEPHDSMSARSNTEGEGSCGLDRSLSHSAHASEFYDAWEELSTESGPQSARRDVEAELREMRLSLLLEIEKRKQAEDVLNSMRIQWLMIREQFALVGIKLPLDLVAAKEGEQLDPDPAEEMSCQLYIARFVSNSIGRGIAKAEVEMEMEAHIDSKNFEIVRLSDRLQYYEAVNREMSQRNQETIETARRLRQRRKRRQRWVWGAIAATITLGSGALAWSYISTGRESPSAPESYSEHDSVHIR